MPLKMCRPPFPPPPDSCPPECPEPPTYRKMPTRLPRPFSTFTFTPKRCSIADVDEAAEITIAQPLSALNGVAQVQVFGQKQYAVRVQLDPRELASTRNWTRSG